jgi:hypothetical protein
MQMDQHTIVTVMIKEQNPWSQQARPIKIEKSGETALHNSPHLWHHCNRVLVSVSINAISQT